MEMMNTKTLPLPGIQEIRSDQKTFNGHCFPLILSPMLDCEANVLSDWCDVIHENLSGVKGLLGQYGTILFRDFPIGNSHQFEQFTKSIGYKNVAYSGVASRKHVHGIVSTANDAPPEVSLGFHHEMTYLKHPPDAVFFYCDVPPSSGGQTPVAFSAAVYRKMLEKEPDFVSRLEREGVYLSSLYLADTDPQCPGGRGWKEVYGADSHKQLEDTLTAGGSSFEWQQNGSVEISQAVRPAITTNKFTGEKVWFNSLGIVCPSWYYGYKNKAAYRFPNGDDMPERALRVLEEVLEECAVDFTWHKVSAHTSVV